MGNNLLIENYLDSYESIHITSRSNSRDKYHTNIYYNFKSFILIQLFNLTIFNKFEKFKTCVKEIYIYYLITMSRKCIK